MYEPFYGCDRVGVRKFCECGILYSSLFLVFMTDDHFRKTAALHSGSR